MASREKLSLAEHQGVIQHRKRLILLFASLTIGLFLLNFYLPDLVGHDQVDSNLNIFFLINLNVVLLLIAFLLFLRNLVKVIYDRRHKALGFRLKSKLTLAFLLVSALPMFVFFFIGNGLLRNSVNFWFKGQLQLSLSNTEQSLQFFKQEQKSSLLIRAHQIEALLQKSAQASAKVHQKERPNLLQAALQDFTLDGIVIYDSNLIPSEYYFYDADTLVLWKPIDPTTTNLSSISDGMSFLSSFDNGEIQRVIIPLHLLNKIFYLEVSTSLTGAKFFQLQTIRQNVLAQKKLLLLKEPIDANLTAYLLLFTALLIAASTWFGYYLARNIVEPLEILVEGTEHIAKGNLDFQITLEVSDEIGMLLNAFDAMTAKLRQKQKELAKSEAELFQTYQALEERGLFLELVLQNIQSGIFFIDNSGYVKGINPYMIQLSKITTKKIIGRHYKGILSKEELQFFEKLNRMLNESGETSIKEETHISVNKRTIHISMELNQLKTPQGEGLGRLLVVHDLTDLDRSTRANAWKEVARRIAHEIKNPLTPIQLSAQRINRKYVDGSEETKMLETATGTIINEVNNLKNMVNEFSKFARMPEITCSPGDINEILKEVAQLYASGLPSNIKLKLKLSSHMPTLMLDKEPMKRAFTNLVDNSVAAMKEGGSITLSSSYVKNFRTVRLEIIDEGQGIPKEMIPRIFDPYVTTKKEGTGLGLAIVQQIITDHGGFIRLENIEKGTKFSIELPANYRGS